MDLGLEWHDISSFSHSTDIGLEWVDMSEPTLSTDIGIEWVDISEPAHSHDIGIEWVDISEPELNAEIGIEWVDISETKLDGEIGLEWHDMEFEEMHIAAGPCDCDNIGEFLLQEQHSDSLYDDVHHEDYFLHDEHEQVHTFFEDLSDFFPNGER